MSDKTQDGSWLSETAMKNESDSAHLDGVHVNVIQHGFLNAALEFQCLHTPLKDEVKYIYCMS